MSIRRYRNPILPGFHPDPSICRVGEDYFLVTSSFQWFPGVPVFHSCDLTRWEQIGFCLHREDQLPLRQAASSAGIYAPTLRWWDGQFYMITTNVSSGGNFLVTARNPVGPWSNPVWIDLPGIDPSLFFDEDGTVYVQSTGNGDGIVQAELDLSNGRLRTPARPLWPGTGGRYPEGPHLYRLGNRYYLMIAEGGTEYGHMVTVARSETPWGPFASCPSNPILTHRNTNFHPIQGLGHADLVQTPDGSWWMICLGFRTVGGCYHHLGRETFLAPVTWTPEGWPMVNHGRLLELEMEENLPPAAAGNEPSVRDDFDGNRLRLCWNFLRNPAPQSWSLQERPGCLRLYRQAAGLDEAGSPALVARRQQHLEAVAATAVEFYPETPTEEAGLTVFMDEKHHADLVVSRESGGRVIRLRQRIGNLAATFGRMEVPDHGWLILQARACQATYDFFAGSADRELKYLGNVEAKYLSSEVAGGFTGVYLGLVAEGTGRDPVRPADFDWFDYLPGRA